MLDKILLTHAAYGFPVQSTAFLLKARAGTVIPFHATGRMMVRIEFEQPLRKQRQVGAFPFRALEITAAYAERDDLLDFRMLQRAVDPRPAVHAVFKLHPIRVIIKMDDGNGRGLIF